MTTERTIAWSAGTWRETIIKRTAVVERATATNTASKGTIILATVAKTTVIVWTIHSIVIWTAIERTSIYFLSVCVAKRMITCNRSSCTALTIEIAERLATTIIATVESIAHTESRFLTSNTDRARTAEFTSVIPASATIHSPAVSTTIYCIEMRSSEEEVISAWVAGIDAEVEVTSIPVKRTVEIACGTE